MIYGNLIVIRVQGDKVVSVATNVLRLAVVVIDQDAAEGADPVLFPLNEFKNGDNLNAEIDAAYEREAS